MKLEYVKLMWLSLQGDSCKITFRKIKRYTYTWLLLVDGKYVEGYYIYQWSGAYEVSHHSNPTTRIFNSLLEAKHELINSFLFNLKKQEEIHEKRRKLDERCNQI